MPFLTDILESLLMPSFDCCTCFVYLSSYVVKGYLAHISSSYMLTLLCCCSYLMLLNIMLSTLFHLFDCLLK